MKLYFKVKMWSFYWIGPWTEMGVCLLLADTASTCQGSGWERHPTSAPRTWSRPIVSFNAGSCDCLHLYSEIHTDTLYNLERNIQVRHNPSICMNTYAVGIYLLPHQCRTEWMRFVITELKPVYRTFSYKCFASPGRPVPTKISSLEIKMIVFLFLISAA